MGWNVYEKAREEILIALPENLRIQVATKFADFESIADNLDSEEKRERLNTILGVIVNNAERYGIVAEDLDEFFVPEFCKILDYYDILSEKCTISTQ
jgi:hypothetical protein